MTRTRYRFIKGDPNPYFVTATAVHWLPLFSHPEVAAIVFDSLRFLIEQKRLQLYAYVVMENHLHLVADAVDIGKEIGTFKSYTARRCIDFYQARGMKSILSLLAFFKPGYKVDSSFQIWQEGSHPQRIEDEVMLEQKIAYIHQNPVRRGFVELPEHWRYSSAQNYAGMQGVLPVVWDSE
jgi:putative transposase